MEPLLIYEDDRPMMAVNFPVPTAPGGVMVNNPRILYKVPQVAYQAYFDMAMMDGTEDKYDTKAKIFTDLKEMIADKFPSYGIIAFSDYSRDEADRIAARTGYPITWGMYLVLEVGGQMESFGSTVEQNLLQSPPKHINDGNQEEEG